MERDIKEVDYQKLDRLLAELYNYRGQARVSIGGTYNSLYRGETNFDERDWAIYCHDLRVLGLAESYELNGNAMKILNLGKTVHENGGWLTYKAMLEEKERKEFELRVREVEASETAAKSATSSTRAAWVAAIFSLVSIIFSVFQYYANQTTNEELETLKKRVSQIEIQQKNLQKPKAILH